MDLDREIRLRYRDLVLAVAAAMALDAALVLLVYVVDASPLGPLRRFGGPWGLPCIAEETCLLRPCRPCPPEDPGCSRE